jgi:hypothetical protein
LKTAKVTLDDIKASAEIEEALGFDPSGSSNVYDSSDTVQESPGRTRSWNGERAPSSDDTDLTSITTSAKSLRLDDLRPFDDDGFQNADAGIENATTEEKVSILSASFPDLKTFDIKHVLERCGDNVERAIDELLSRAYLQDAYDTDGEHHAVPKGVDGFAQNSAFQPQKRGKGKGKKKRPNATHRRSSSTPAAGATTVYNKWATTENDIEFIVTRTTLSPKAVRSAYHSSGGSLRTTIQTLSEANLKESTPSDDAEEAVIEVHAAELSMNFPMIQRDQIKGIVQMTYPSTTSAQELARALFTSSSTGERPKPLEAPIIPQYSKLRIDEQDDDAGFVTRSAPRAGIPSHTDAPLLAANYHAARSAAFAQAAAAYRRSRSQPLMGGAAAYYADVGRTASAAADAYSYTAANALVARQAVQGQIDLHGVDVKNGVRISCERVQDWWDGGQAEWARQGKVQGNGGYRIVTGVGRHSVAGKGVLGPAVRKALVADGWKVEEAQGVLTVVGRARR